MKPNRSLSGLFIWLSCSIFVVVMTIGITLAYNKYGTGGVLALLFCSEFLLQFYKIIYQGIARKKTYELKLVRNITNCWTVYMILNTILCTGGLFAYLLLFTENNTCGISKGVYCLIILVAACLLSLMPIQRFVRHKQYSGKKRYPAKLISSFVPRFVILYTFVVYYLIAYVNYSSTSDLIPSLCVLYIGIERLISMFQIVSEYSKQEYYSLFKDTVKWMRKERKMD